MLRQRSRERGLREDEDEDDSLAQDQVVTSPACGHLSSSSTTATTTTLVLHEADTSTVVDDDYDDDDKTTNPLAQVERLPLADDGEALLKDHHEHHEDGLYAAWRGAGVTGGRGGNDGDDEVDGDGRHHRGEAMVMLPLMTTKAEEDEGQGSSSSSTSSSSTSTEEEEAELAEAAERENRRARKRARRIVGVTVHLLSALLLLSLAIRYLPTTPLPNSSLLRDLLRNDRIEWAGVVMWHLLLLLGFMFVAQITEKRPNPLLSRRGHYWEICKLLASGPALFFLGPMFVLAVPHSNPRSITTGATEEVMGTLLRIDPQSSPEEFTFVYNYLFFVVPFYAGLHITYMDKNLFLRAVGDKLVVPSRWKTYTKDELIALAGLVLFLLLVSALQIVLLALDGVLGWYLLAYAVICIGLGVLSFCIRRTHELHVHHYLFGLVLLPLPRLFNPISSCTMAVAAGVYVEGIARWSMASLWDRLSPA